MIKVKIICVGKIKENFFSMALDEYSKRLSRFCDFSIMEIAETRIDKAEPALIEKALLNEGKSIIAACKDSFVVLLDRQGQMCDSVFLSNVLKDAANRSGEIVFLIGSSFGVSQAVKNRADMVLSFGAITLPHQLFRVVLTEQIYRGFSILTNTPYHK